MKQETMNQDSRSFHIRFYRRQELALLYFPYIQPASAWRKLKGELLFNPRLRQLVWRPGTGRKLTRSFSPKEVILIVEELGEP